MDKPSARLDPLAVLRATPAIASWLRRSEEEVYCQAIRVHEAAHPLLAALAAGGARERPVVLVADGLKTQETFLQDFLTWISIGTADTPSTATPRALFFPSWEILPHEARLPHADVISDRLQTLSALSGLSASGASRPVVITSVPALLQRTLPAQWLREHTRILKKGDTIDPLDLVEWLEDQSYEPEAKVTQKGEISLRGGILDVFPLANAWPVRLEFFGNELESLRLFDPSTQLSREEVGEISLAPAGELGILQRWFSQSTGTDSKALATLLDYLPSGSLVLFSNPVRCESAAEQYQSQIPDQDRFHVQWGQLKESLRTRGIRWAELDERDEYEIDCAETNALSLSLTGLDLYRPIGERLPDVQVVELQRKDFFSQLHRWVRQDYGVHLFCNNEGERQRFSEIWSEYGFGDPSKAGLQLRLGSLSRGFLSEEAKLVVVTDAEVFGRYRIQRPRRMRQSHASASRSALDINFSELEEGDYVVHLQYGIGKYHGLQRLSASPSTKPGATTSDRGGEECLVLEYAPARPEDPAPKLYVPVTEAHLVSKYVGAGRARPPLNTLTGTRWAKAKAQATEAVRDLAAELLGLQAARASQVGYAFPPEHPWQREFESAFLYEETIDQLHAIHQTKVDMEQPKPMDRLVCGDVGFGKTEVAIRATFKSVLAGKQVAILVPTTVLAQQHYNTFRERVADYPVRVEMLSRFRTRREQDQVISDLARGVVDVVIGTHRLLQEDVVFKDLGLVVVDEEQRFGVMHKEKLKQMRKMVDVLTLTATPIPRTLYLALTGARDMSTIETPPQDRLPVETIIAAYDERLIRDAMQRELNRGGQVFYLHNRIFDILAVAAKIRTLVPRARVEVGHGQMEAGELEEVMGRFISGQSDILLSTTIIESGIDIPNANTIIIDRADRFGLSDLYQLRGRVGRYKHQAYAYLLIPRHAGLLADARKRINAIQQFSKPGSGFKIAMRDLEIRGAGNLLGSEQSGHITAVGFELYCHLLKQSVAVLKGEPVRQRVEVNTHFDFLSLAAFSAGESKGNEDPSTSRELHPMVDGDGRPCACLPLTYIPEPQQRIEIYRKLAQVQDASALEAIKQELRDRFGPLPPAVDFLFQVAVLRQLAAERRITEMETRGDKLMMTRNGDYIMVGGKFPRLTKVTAKAKLNEIKRYLLAVY